MGLGVHPFIQRARRTFLGKRKPLWYDAVVVKYPPVRFEAKGGRPPRIAYPEDKIRQRFYAEHPLELQSPMDMDEQSADTSSIGRYCRADLGN